MEYDESTELMCHDKKRDGSRSTVMEEETVASIKEQKANEV